MITHIGHAVNLYKRAERPWQRRLWAKVDRRGDEECWPWRGFVTHDGQPTLRWGKSYKGAHRLVYEMRHGLIGRKHLRWTCATRPCMNPAHMAIGGNSRKYSFEVRERIREDARLLRELGFSHAVIGRTLGVSAATARRSVLCGKR